MLGTKLQLLESAIAEHRGNLDAWLDSVYDHRSNEREYNGELDCAYESWGEIESNIGAVFDAQLTQSLSEPALKSLLFFASRNEECGRMIAWLSHIGPFSNIGNLSHPDFLFLCDAALVGPEDFVDHQLTVCFHKIPTLTEQHIEIVLRFFDRQYAYTKRVAAHVLAAKGFDGIPDLAQQLWVFDDCEFTKLSALHALKESSSDAGLLAELLKKFKSNYDVAAHDHLQTHIARLES